jgi:hypothetical protein
VPCGTHPRSSPCQPPSIGESDEGDESMMEKKTREPAY